MAKNNYVPYKTRNKSIHRRSPINRKQKQRFPRRLIILPLLLLAIAAIIIAAINWGSWTADNSDSGGDTSLTSHADSSVSSPSSVGNESSLSSQSLEKNIHDLTPAKERDITNLTVETFNTMMIVGNAGYRYFEFSESNSITYIDTVTDTAKALSGRATVYSLICPTATDIMLPQTFLADKGTTSDQQKALDYLTTSINAIEPSVKTVPLFDVLKAHCDENIYFDTDRNWTALGAYYAYTRFATAKGITPTSLDSFQKYEYAGFRGTLYSQSNNHSALEETETLTAYQPSFSASVTITDNSGNTFDSGLIVDVSDYDSNMKYCAFLGGNYPYILVQNNDVTDRSACIVIEETMGSAMVPFLAAHYEYVHVIDYRTWSGSLNELVNQYHDADVLFINSIEHTSDYDANNSLQGLIP